MQGLTLCAGLKQGWRRNHVEVGSDVSDGVDLGFEPLSDDRKVEVDARKREWTSLLAKLYEIDPLICKCCGSEMKVIAVIQDPKEIKKILEHLLGIRRTPPGFDPSSLNRALSRKSADG